MRRQSRRRMAQPQVGNGLSVVGCRLWVVGCGKERVAVVGVSKSSLLWVQTCLDAFSGCLPASLRATCIGPMPPTGHEPAVVGHVVRVSGLRDIELRHVARYASNVTYNSKSTTYDLGSWKATCVGPTLHTGHEPWQVPSGLEEGRAPPREQALPETSTNIRLPHFPATNNRQPTTALAFPPAAPTIVRWIFVPCRMRHTVPTP